MIPRIHLFEFEDLERLPQFLRNYLTDFLQYVTSKFNLYDSAIPILKKSLLNSGKTKIIDLGSGAGGGMIDLYYDLKDDIPGLMICLTDINPNLEAFSNINKKSNNNILFSECPIDATNIPDHLTGFRTMFRSFHHFKPKEAKEIIQDSINNNEPIGIFEAQERSLLFTLYFFVINPILILFVTPFITPFTWKRFFFTYIIPIVPFLICWDATISCLRTYEPRDLKQMVSELENQKSFFWEIQKIRNNNGILISLVGFPKNPN